jgi:thiol-disulfide isomerase/thioredoxin
MGDVLENREDLKTYLSVTKSDTTIIKLTASWCGPCKRLDKEAIASASPAVTWYECDVDENQTTLGYCTLKSIPSFCLIKDGIFKGVKAGASSPEEVLGWLAEFGVPLK